MASIDEMLFDALRRSNPIGRVIEDFKRTPPKFQEAAGTAMQVASTAPTGAAEALIGKLMVSPAFRTSATEEEARRRALEQDDLFVQALLGFEQAQGNPIQRAMAANEAGAAGREFEQWVYNTALDATNLIPIPTGKANKALQATRQSEKARELMNGVDFAGLIADRAVPGGVDSTGDVALRKLIAGVGENGTGGLGPTIREMQGIGPLPQEVERATTLSELIRSAETGVGVDSTGDVAFRDLIRGAGADGKGGLGPVLRETQPFGPSPDEIAKIMYDTSIGGRTGDVGLSRMIRGVGTDGGRGLGPKLPKGPSILPPELGPTPAELLQQQFDTSLSGGIARGDLGSIGVSKMARGIGGDGGRGLGPVLPKAAPAPATATALADDLAASVATPLGQRLELMRGVGDPKTWRTLVERATGSSWLPGTDGTLGDPAADALLTQLAKDFPTLTPEQVTERVNALRQLSGLAPEAAKTPYGTAIAHLERAYGSEPARRGFEKALFGRAKVKLDPTTGMWLDEAGEDVSEAVGRFLDTRALNPKANKRILDANFAQFILDLKGRAPANLGDAATAGATKVDEFGVNDYVPTPEDLANGWGSEISLPFDQQRGVLGDYADQLEMELAQGEEKYRAANAAQRKAWKPQLEAMKTLARAAREEASKGNISTPKSGPSGSSMNFTVPGMNAAIGLGMKALTNPAIGPALTGGLAGGATMGATGGITGALATPEDRWGGFKQGFAGGAVLGAALGSGTFAYGLRHTNKNTWTNLMKHSWELSRGEIAETAKNAKGHSVLPTPTQFISLWKNQTVSTMRQFGQDGTWNHLVMDLLQGKGAKKLLGQITEQISERLNLKGFDAYSTPLQEILTRFGMKDRELHLGMPIVEAVALHGISRSKSVVGSALLSTFGPGNVLGGIAGAAKGAVLPEWSGMIRHANGALNRGFRETAFWHEVDNELVPMAIEAFKKLGYDLSNVPVNQLDRAKVEQLYGAKAGAMWQKTMENIVPMAESRVRYLFGDYTPGQKGAIGLIEKITGPGMPFSSWAIRAYPVALDMAIQNPWVALGVYQFLQATAGQAGKDGRPRWTAGKVPISTEVPLLGAGARTLLGGQKGTAYVDPVGSLSPVGGDLFQPGADQEGPQSLYQQISEIIGRAGLPGLSPMLQGIAYMLGLDYKGPGNMSRTQGMENSLGLIPGNVDLPGWGDVALRAGRAKLSPAFAGTELGAKLGATGDKYPTVYDPVARRYGELVVKATQKSLDDPANRAYLYDLAAGTGELYDQARREVLLGGLARNAFSTTSPIGVATQGEGAREAKREREGVPYDYTALQEIKAMDIPSFMREAELQNRQYKEANPASASYAVGSRAEAEDILMQDVLDRFRGKRPPSPAAQQQQLASILAAAGRGAQYRNLTPLPTEPVTMPAPRRIASEPKK